MRDGLGGYVYEPKRMTNCKIPFKLIPEINYKIRIPFIFLKVSHL